MKKLLTLIGLLCCIYSMHAQVDSKLINNQLKDFHVFKTCLYEMEAKPFRHISEDSLTYYLTEFENQLKSAPLSHKSLFMGYARIVAKIQSGHTSIDPSKHVIEEWVKEQNSFPLDVVLFGKKLYLQEDYALRPSEEMLKLSASKRKKYIVPVHTEIVSIDGKTIEEWIEAISPYVPSDEDFLDFRYFIIKDAFELYRSFAVNEKKDSITFQYLKKRDTASLTIKADYPPVLQISSRFDQLEEQYKQQEKSFGQFEVLNNDLAYFKFHSFLHCSGKKYSAFLKNSFATIHQKNIPTIVVDVRGNLGGVIQLEFLRFVKIQEGKKQIGGYNVEKRQKPTYKKYIVKNKAYKRNKQLLKKVKKMEKRHGFKGLVSVEDLDQEPVLFDGKIIVLTDEGSFSASSLLAAHLKDLCHAKIVGVPAGGSFYEGVSGTNSVRLPNSKLVIDFNPNYYFSSLKNKTLDQSIKNPDIEYIELYEDDPKVANKNKKEFLKVLKEASKL